MPSNHRIMMSSSTNQHKKQVKGLIHGATRRIGEEEEGGGSPPA
jgi:hypothetical protein